MERFDLAVRMIRHEARTGTIRALTGFSEDRIRKIYTTYFKVRGEPAIRRHRGKSPTQIAPFVGSADRQSEATLLACLLLFCGVLRLDSETGNVRTRHLLPVRLGQRLCNAFESYRQVWPSPALSFERTWCLFNALAKAGELYFARCDHCYGPYIQDAYALDYHRCPFCELKDQRRAV